MSARPTRGTSTGSSSFAGMSARPTRGTSTGSSSFAGMSARPTRGDRTASADGEIAISFNPCCFSLIAPKSPASSRSADRLAARSAGLVGRRPTRLPADPRRTRADHKIRRRRCVFSSTSPLLSRRFEDFRFAVHRLDLYYRPGAFVPVGQSLLAGRPCRRPAGRPAGRPDGRTNGRPDGRQWWSTTCRQHACRQ